MRGLNGTCGGRSGEVAPGTTWRVVSCAADHPRRVEELMAETETLLKLPSDLTATEKAMWDRWVMSDAGYASPFFSRQFSEICEDVRASTRVLVIVQSGDPVGFLPFQLEAFGRARPLAGPLGDVQGVIAPTELPVLLSTALGQVGVNRFDFTSARADQSCFETSGARSDGSWCIDVGAGFDSWRDDIGARSRSVIKNIDMRYRRLQRDAARFEFCMDDRREDAFEKMIELKREQYRRTGVFDAFSVNWTRGVLEGVLARRSECFSGLCSTLRIDGELAAVHVGMASDRVLHFWFPAFDARYQRVSPGLLLLVEMARYCAQTGRQGIELGAGDYRFKSDLSNAQIDRVSGAVHAPNARGRIIQFGSNTLGLYERMPVGRFKTWPRRLARRLDQIAAFKAA